MSNYFDSELEELNESKSIATEETITQNGTNNDLVPDKDLETIVVQSVQIELNTILDEKEYDLYQNYFFYSDNSDTKKIIDLDHLDYNSDEFKNYKKLFEEIMLNQQILTFIEDIQTDPSSEKSIDFENLIKWLEEKQIAYDKETLVLQFEKILKNENYKNINKDIYKLFKKKDLIEKIVNFEKEKEEFVSFAKVIIAKIYKKLQEVSEENMVLVDSLQATKSLLDNSESNDDELERLSILVKQKEEEIKQLQESLQKMREENEHNSELYTSLEVEINTLKQEVETKEHQIASLNDEKSSHDETIKQLQETINKLELSSDGSNASDERVSLLESELKEKEAQLENLIAENNELKKQHKELPKDEEEHVHQFKTLDEHNEEAVNEEEEEDGDNESKKPTSLLKKILYGVGGFFLLIVLWMVYAFSVTPTQPATPPIKINKVTPVGNSTPKVAATTPVIKSYDFNKKISPAEFKKQKFDIYVDDEFAVRVNGKKFKRDDVVNGYTFKKTLKGMGKIVFLDEAGEPVVITMK